MKGTLIVLWICFLVGLSLMGIILALDRQNNTYAGAAEVLRTVTIIVAIILQLASVIILLVAGYWHVEGKLNRAWYFSIPGIGAIYIILIILVFAFNL